MIKSFTATTHEIDDAAVAVAGIKAALDLDGKLLKSSLGIISCFSEFEETGVLKAICEALPFDCIGSTTCLCTAGGGIDQLILTITVLTSDDCEFRTIELPVNEDYGDFIYTELSAFMKQSAEKPALFLSYFPLIKVISGDMMLEAIDKATGGIPAFGTSAIDHTIDFSTSKTIYNGNMFSRSIVLCAIYGKPEFSFGIASFEKNRIKNQKAIITESRGNILIGVNGKAALEYFKEIGLERDELASGNAIVPLVIDYTDDSSQIARAVFALTPEGYLVCGGKIPENKPITIARINGEDVLHTTEQALRPLVSEDAVVLSYSCLARYLVLGVNNKAEAEKIREVAGNTHYLFACSSGEICPLPDADGKLRNFYHNYTNVFCRLS